MMCLVKTILGYLILMFAGSNLLGLVFRGLIPSYKKDTDGNIFLAEQINSSQSIIMTIIFSLITILYFIALYYYWSIGVVITATMLIVARIPDLLYELKTGEKISSKKFQKRPIDILCTVILWAALPVLWYSLCYPS